MENRKDAGADTPNPPRDVQANGKDLDAMSAVELAEELELIWGEMDEDSYDEKIIDAYLDALDRKAPVPEHPDAQTAYKRFLDLTRGTGGDKPKHRVSRAILRAAVAAVVAVVVVLGAMITVQAAGVDVFGRIARWTKETFSFGESTFGDVNDTPKENEEKDDLNVAKHNDDGPSELQKALDTYGITEVKEPSRLPEGYALENVAVTDLSDFGIVIINATYTDSRAYIYIDVAQGDSASPGQVQKDDDFVELYEKNGTVVYIIKNENNYTVTWSVDGYEVQVSGNDENQIRNVAESML